MDEDKIAAQIFAFLIEECGLDSSTADTSATLFSSGLLNSMDVLSVVMFVEETFSVKVSPFEISIEKFDSVAQMTKFIQEKRAV
jgi:acyl carrier protein